MIVYLLGQKGELGVGASWEGACCIGVLHYHKCPILTDIEVEHAGDFVWVHVRVRQGLTVWTRSVRPSNVQGTLMPAEALKVVGTQQSGAMEEYESGTELQRRGNSRVHGPVTGHLHSVWSWVGPRSLAGVEHV